MCILLYLVLTKAAFEFTLIFLIIQINLVFFTIHVELCFMACMLHYYTILFSIWHT